MTVNTKLAIAVVRMATAVGLLLPLTAAAAPMTLKLSFLSSDRSMLYLSLVKPFVDAINNDRRNLLKIEVYFSGALSPVPAKQPQLVLDGTADIAFVVPGLIPERFLDNGAIELPSLFRDRREATLVHTRLVAANALRGYEDFFVIGAVATEPETIHSRKPIATLADLKGQKLRVNNAVVGIAMARLGAAPEVFSLNDTPNAISSGAVDGAVLQLPQLFDFGIGRLLTNHYLLGTGSAQAALVMSRKVFDNLPAPAQTLIRERSGEWVAARYIEMLDADSRRVTEQIKADPRRKVVYPSQADLANCEGVFESIIDKWAMSNSRNRELLSRVRSEIAKLRSPN